jgi:hypothetical protein
MFWQCGLGESEPTGIQFSTQASYTHGTSKALFDLQAEGLLDNGFLSPPTAVHGTALIESIEAATSVPLQSIMANASPYAGKVVSLVQNALNGEVAAVIAGTVDLALTVVDALSAVPVVGQVAMAVSSILNALLTLLGPDPAEEAAKKCFQNAKQVCKAHVQAQYVRKTALSGPTPADQFRECMFAYQRGQFPPPTVPSIYVLLCGAETQGFGFTRPQYQALAGSLGGGIPQATQRRMWSLIKGIFGSVQDPRPGSFDVHGDQGRSLFPLLQDIILNEYRVGRINKQFVQAISDQLTSKIVSHGSASVGAGTKNVWCSCADAWPGHGPVRLVDLSTPFEKSIKDWELILKDKFSTVGPDGKLQWTMYPEVAPTPVLKPGMKAVLSFDAAKTKLSSTRLMQVFNEAVERREREASFRRWGDRVMIGAGSLAAGYLAFEGVRRFGPRRR